MSEPRYGYMCTVDYDYEVGCALGGNIIYPSPEDLLDNRKCVRTCGIVKVKVEKVEEVTKSRLFTKETEKEEVENA